MEQMEITPENDEPESRVFGLTGGIGSGKSSVGEILERAGCKVYYSDSRAKEIVNESENLKQKIITLLGSESYDKSGLYNRKFIAGIVFENPDKLAALNSIIHPAVKEDFKIYLENNPDEEFIFKETALLFELDLDASCKKSILVTADDNARIKRVMDRDDKTYREVLSVMEVQMPEKDKIRRADYVLYNNSTLEDLEIEVAKLLEQIKN